MYEIRLLFVIVRAHINAINHRTMFKTTSIDQSTYLAGDSVVVGSAIHLPIPCSLAKAQSRVEVDRALK